jgi:hypothetical protein
MISTIKLSTKTKGLLAELKVHKREPYEDVILDLLKRTENEPPRIVPTLAEIKKTVIPILKKYSVVKAAIFGSFARGEARSDSDVDLLIELSTDKPLFRIINLKLDLEDALERKVDLVSYGWIDPHIKERIMAEQIRII